MNKTANNKNQKTLESFIRYCNQNPEERFWQALRNWSGYCFIYGTRERIVNEVEYTAHDTFYDE